MSEACAGSGALADGAQGAPRGQPLVDALHVEAVLARQHPLLIAVPACMRTAVASSAVRKLKNYCWRGRSICRWRGAKLAAQQAEPDTKQTTVAPGSHFIIGVVKTQAARFRL